MPGTITIPPNDHLWESLPKEVRDEVRLWIQAFETVPLVRPLSRAFAQIARIVGRDESTVERRYYDLKRTPTWEVFVDGRRTAPVANSRAKDPRFLEFWRKLCEDHKRCTRSAIVELHAMWRRREAIPGFEDLPGWPNIPKGLSQRNLYKIKPTKTELALFRIGMSKAAPGLAQVFSTRVGLWAGSHVMFDDVWHDNFVRVGERGAVGRVLELGALCVHTGCRLSWGCKPRLPKADNPDQMEHTKERNMRLLVAKYLWEHGYSPRGSIFLAEHGTAAIREYSRRILHDATGGLLTVRDSGITGEEQAVLQSWRGERRGNPRFKASLEVLHSLIHNRLDALPAQTGPDRDRRPETLAHMLDYQTELMELAARLPEHRRALLIHPLLEYHSQFLPLLMDLYRVINARTDHRLEGWEKCGYMTTEYRLSPETDSWLTAPQYMALPDTSRAILAEAIRCQPDHYSRTRRLSPAEAFAMGSGDLIRPPASVICDLLANDLARVEKVKGAYIRFRDAEIDPEEIIYHARVTPTSGGRDIELREGESYEVFCNPFAPDDLFVLDSRRSLIGIAQRVHRVSRLDQDGLLRAFGEKAHRNAERLAPARMRHSDDQARHAEMLRTNAALADSERPATPEEKQQARALTARLSRETGDIEDFLPDPETQIPTIEPVDDGSELDAIL